jgi:predicted RNA-binding protein Jag
MTENENPTPSTTPSTTDAAPAAPQAPNPEKMAQAEKVLGEILARLEVKARLELKAAADGGISVAMHLEQELPGLAPGKRSHIVDALQFLANKIVNRPTGERRWISLGVGGHPEPRPPKSERPPRAPPAEGAPAQAGAPAPAPAKPAHAKGPRPEKRAEGAPEQRPAAAKPPPAARAEPEELKLDVPEDPAMTALARKVAERSAQHGRFYAVAPMKAEDRARMLKATAGVAGVKVTIEGEGRSRRVLFSPEKPTPMPKKGLMPDYDEDEAEA